MVLTDETLKKDLRRFFLSKRSKAYEYKNILAHAIAFLTSKQPACIGGYLAYGQEINVSNLVRHIFREKWAMPIAFEDYISYVPYHSGDPIHKNIWGVDEPLKKTPHVEPDLVFVPSVAVSKAGVRLGRGKGIFDRYIGYRKKGGASFLTVALAYDYQFCDNLPMMDHDQKIDYVITPKGVLKVI